MPKFKNMLTLVIDIEGALVKELSSDTLNLMFKLKSVSKNNVVVNAKDEKSGDLKVFEVTPHCDTFFQVLSQHYEIIAYSKLPRHVMSALIARIELICGSRIFS